MAAKDYYAVLGVPKTASADDIRKAYRSLARTFHPDVNKAADAATKFNDVQQAYDVLSDDQKRRIYDQHGSYDGSNPYANGSARPGAGGMPDIDSEDLSEIFNSIFGGAAPFGEPPHAGHRGRGGRAGPRQGASEAELAISFETAVRGGVEPVRLSSNGKGRAVEVKIPAGIEEGAALRVRGERGQGDVLLRVRIGRHPTWRRGEFEETGKGLDLYLDLPLTFAEAALGATVPVPTLTGTVELTIPPGSASGRKLRLRGKGISGAEGRQGDLYVVVKIVPPSGPFSDAEQAALRAMDARSPNPRA